MLVASILTWVAAALLVPAPTAARAFLIVPLVLVPRILETDRRGWLPWIAFLAALPLALSFAFAPGTTALALVLPWLAVTGFLAAEAALHGLRSLPAILMPPSAPHLARDAAFVTLAVGAGAAAMDRAGFAPFGVSADIILMTAVHFHVLGFGLLMVTSRLVRNQARVAVGGLDLLLIGLPITAIGFVAGSLAVNWLGAIVVGAAGLLIALAIIRDETVKGRARTIAIAAGVALLIGVPMGPIWASAQLFGFDFLALETMVRVHGILNLAGTVAAALVLVRGRAA